MPFVGRFTVVNVIDNANACPGKLDTCTTARYGLMKTVAEIGKGDGGHFVPFLDTF